MCAYKALADWGRYAEVWFHGACIEWSLHFPKMTTTNILKLMRWLLQCSVQLLLGVKNPPEVIMISRAMDGVKMYFCGIFPPNLLSARQKD